MTLNIQKKHDVFLQILPQIPFLSCLLSFLYNLYIFHFQIQGLFVFVAIDTRVAAPYKYNLIHHQSKAQRAHVTKKCKYEEKKVTGGHYTQPSVQNVLK